MEKDSYGIYYYFSFTNNFYDVEQFSKLKFEKINHLEFEQIEWYPVLSSCGHIVHQACFDKSFMETKSEDGHLTKMLTGFSETNCPLCKTL